MGKAQKKVEQTIETTTQGAAETKVRLADCIDQLEAFSKIDEDNQQTFVNMYQGERHSVEDWNDLAQSFLESITEETPVVPVSPQDKVSSMAAKLAAAVAKTKQESVTNNPPVEETEEIVALDTTAAATYGKDMSADLTTIFRDITDKKKQVQNAAIRVLAQLKTDYGVDTLRQWPEPKTQKGKDHPRIKGKKIPEHGNINVDKEPIDVGSKKLHSFYRDLFDASSYGQECKAKINALKDGAAKKQGADIAYTPSHYTMKGGRHKNALKDWSRYYNDGLNLLMRSMTLFVVWDKIETDLKASVKIQYLYEIGPDRKETKTVQNTPNPIRIRNADVENSPDEFEVLSVTDVLKLSPELALEGMKIDEDGTIEKGTLPALLATLGLKAGVVNGPKQDDKNPPIRDHIVLLKVLQNLVNYFDEAKYAHYLVDALKGKYKNRDEYILALGDVMKAIEDTWEANKLEGEYNALVEKLEQETKNI
jgi:hypothetical protein